MLGKQTVAVKVARQDKVSERVLQQFRNEVAILHANRNEGLVEFKGACLWEVSISPHALRTPHCQYDLTGGWSLF